MKRLALAHQKDGPAIPPPPPSLASRGERATAAPGGWLDRIDPPTSRANKTCYQPSTMSPYTCPPCLRAKHRTDYLLLDFEDQPKRHFIDNVDVKFVAFVKSDRNEPGSDSGVEDYEKYLCDVTPAPGTTTITLIAVTSINSTIPDYFHLSGNVRFKVSRMNVISSNVP